MNEPNTVNSCIAFVFTVSSRKDTRLFPERKAMVQKNCHVWAFFITARPVVNSCQKVIVTANGCFEIRDKIIRKLKTSDGISCDEVALNDLVNAALFWDRFAGAKTEVPRYRHRSCDTSFVGQKRKHVFVIALYNLVRENRTSIEVRFPDWGFALGIRIRPSTYL